MFVKVILVGSMTALLVFGSPASAAPTRVCYDRGSEELRARNIRCDTAERLLRRSQREFLPTTAPVIRFRFVGLRWSCRRRVRPAVDDMTGLMAFWVRSADAASYPVRCTANGDRLMQYGRS